VQIGAYGTEKRANDKIRKSDHVHMDMEVRRKWVEGKELYVVCAGRFVERRNAKEWAGRLNGFVYEIR
jgi:septal ring-binding cell division protein DamX